MTAEQVSVSLPTKASLSTATQQSCIMPGSRYCSGPGSGFMSGSPKLICRQPDAASRRRCPTFSGVLASSSTGSWQGNPSALFTMAWNRSMSSPTSTMAVVPAMPLDSGFAGTVTRFTLDVLSCLANSLRTICSASATVRQYKSRHDSRMGRLPALRFRLPCSSDGM